MRLFCFHHAGSSALMYNQLKINGMVIHPIQLNGRDNNKKPYFNSCIEAADSIYTEIEPYLSEPYMFFAHSMGTWIAYSVLSKIIKMNQSQPIKFIISAFCHPFIKTDNAPWIPNTKLDDNDFKEEVKRWGANKQLLEERYWSIFKDRLRADFSLFDTDQSFDKVKASCKILAILPTNDPRIKEHMMLGWADLTNDFEIQKIEGDHFYLVNDINIIQKFICKKILCLHGHQTNSNIMRKQLETHINLMPYNEFNIIDAPNSSNGKTYPEIKIFFSTEKIFYEWYNYDPINDISNGLDNSMKLLEEIVSNYDVVIGFSQGASMVSMLAEKGLVKKAILICHGRYLSKIPIKTESLHLIGLKDEYIKCGTNALELYSNKEVHYFDDIHKIPSDNVSVGKIERFIMV
jgi:medium-chain acyl-[acyl-carrier-protein] hydrolase